MLLWQNIFLILLFVAIWSFIYSSYSLYFLLFNGEFIVMVIFSMFLCSSLIYGNYCFLGLSYLLLILGGLELALNILIILL